MYFTRSAEHPDSRTPAHPPALFNLAPETPSALQAEPSGRADRIGTRAAPSSEPAADREVNNLLYTPDGD